MQHTIADACGLDRSPGMSPDKSRPVVFIVNGEAAVRDSMELLLEPAGLKVACHDSAESFLAAYRSGQTGCIILDVKLPDMSGLQLHNELNRRGCTLPILYLTGHGTIPMSVQAMRCGAVDFLTKPVDPHDFLEKIRALVDGQQYPPERPAASEPHPAQPPASYEQLTCRERTVLDLVLEGHPNKIIAKRLGISYRTVELHRSNILHKTGQHNMIALARGILNHTFDPPAAQ